MKERAHEHHDSTPGTQMLILAKKPALVVGERLGGDGCELAGDFRLIKRPVADGRASDAVQAAFQRWSVADATDNNEGMRCAGGKKGSRGFNRGMTGLDD